MQIKSFFYGINNQEAKENEINAFLVTQGIVVREIFQSTCSISIDIIHPSFKDIGVTITIIYSKK